MAQTVTRIMPEMSALIPRAYALGGSVLSGACNCDTIASMATFDAADDRLRRWIARHRRVFVLTGAGCSTASGIPDYRDDQGEWKRRPPVMIQAFRTQDAVYRRYWARAYVGWPRFTTAAPNAAHRAFAAWESAGTLLQLVTQNVDGLHQRAGSRAVLDLHGRLDVVVCLGAARASAATTLQTAIDGANPGVAGRGRDGSGRRRRHRRLPSSSRSRRRAARVRRPAQAGCRLLWRERAAARYAHAREALARADALLVAGSSLMVYSGFRFVRLAHEAGLPIAIVNRGRTRGDDLAELKIEGDVGSTLIDAVGALA